MGFSRYVSTVDPMGRKIAIYGKGGIGKSTVSSNLTAALGDMGVKVMQVGCDPKHDSTRGLIGGRSQNTVLEYLKTVKPEDRRLEDVMATGYRGCLCVEAGGPEPGVGCAGRGIISAFDLLNDLGAESVDTDITLFDVLGDVVCGGFAVPLRNGYADTVYIVTSGEFMSIYAANNILRGTANYDPDRIGGLIFNSRGDPAEDGRVMAFSEAVGVPVIAVFGRSPIFMEAEKQGKTVVEMRPDSPEASSFRGLAQKVLEGRRYRARFLSEDELERTILGRTSVPEKAAPASVQSSTVSRRPRPYSSRIAEYDEPLNGCAFSGASSVCTSIDGLTTVLHSPKSCAHFTIQLDSNSVNGAMRRGYRVVKAFEDPDVICTDMKEHDMIFGGGKALEHALGKCIAAGKKDIAVITACPPGIIGDDVPGIVGKVERNNPGTRICILKEDGNATGDFMQGVIDAGIGLVERFSSPGETIPFSVNLVGSKTMSSNMQSELAHVSSILSSLGITVNCILPGITDMKGLEGASRATVNLKLNPDVFSDKICRFLEDRYGMKTLEEPVRGGIDGTSRWVRCVARFFGCEERADMIIDGIRERFDRMMDGPRRILSGKTCCIVAINNDVSWIVEAVEGAGLEIKGAYILSRSDHTDDLTDERMPDGFTAIYENDVPDVMRTINSSHPDILLVPAIADVDPSIYQSRLPCAPSTDTFAARGLTDDWIRGMLAPKEEGWRKDVA